MMNEPKNREKFLRDSGSFNMAFKLTKTAQKKWFQLRGYKLLTDVVEGVKFVNGVKQNGDQNQVAA